MSRCASCGDVLPPLNGVEDNDFATQCEECESRDAYGAYEDENFFEQGPCYCSDWREDILTGRCECCDCGRTWYRASESA